MGSAGAGKAANWSQLLLQSGLAWGLGKNRGGMVLTETGSPHEADGEQTGKSQPALPPPARRRPLAPPMGRANTVPAGKAKRECGMPAPAQRRHSDLIVDATVLLQAFWVVWLPEPQ